LFAIQGSPVSLLQELLLLLTTAFPPSVHKEDAVPKNLTQLIESRTHFADAFDASISDERRRLDDYTKPNRGIEAEANPDPGQLEARLGALRSYAERFDLAPALPALPVIVPALLPHSLLRSPPYDDDWAVNGGMAFGAKNDGEFSTLGLEGWSAAGIGLYLRSDEDALATLTPLGTYQYSAFSATAGSQAHSRGGMKVVAFAGSPSPIYEWECQLFDFRPTGALISGVSNTGQVKDAASPAWGLGSRPLAPLNVTVKGGQPVLVWIYSWVDVQENGDEGIFALINTTIRGITLEWGPPLVGPN
jgi:hypothetical protein